MVLDSVPYGVSPQKRLITRELYIKRFDRIRECLVVRLGLTCAQREVALRLLRLWAYYGLVYPKASQVAELPGCSVATFWRTVRLLRDRGLVEVIHRYLLREHAQISNLYRLDRLAELIFAYLGDHGQAHVITWSGTFTRAKSAVQGFYRFVERQDPHRFDGQRYGHLFAH